MQVVTKNVGVSYSRVIRVSSGVNYTTNDQVSSGIVIYNCLLGVIVTIGDQVTWGEIICNKVPIKFGNYHIYINLGHFRGYHVQLVAKSVQRLSYSSS